MITKSTHQTPKHQQNLRPATRGIHTSFSLSKKGLNPLFHHKNCFIQTDRPIDQAPPRHIQNPAYHKNNKNNNMMFRRLSLSFSQESHFLHSFTLSTQKKEIKWYHSQRIRMCPLPSPLFLLSSFPQPIPTASVLKPHPVMVVIPLPFDPKRLSSIKEYQPPTLFWPPSVLGQDIRR